MSAATRRTLVLAASLAVLAGCGSGGAPSAQEQRELDEAERMLDQAPNSLSGIDENMLRDANAAAPPEPEGRPDVR